MFGGTKDLSQEYRGLPGLQGNDYGGELGSTIAGTGANDQMATLFMSSNQAILSESDARKALEIGAAGIIVSHHHGIMNYAIPPLMILPKIVEVIGGRIPIFVDCGVESGMDVYKALALGADAVCVGRAIMPPLKDSGAEGVRDKMIEMNNELKATMQRTGVPSLADMDSSVIHKRDF